jgi:nitric oxide dioxygenase
MLVVTILVGSRNLQNFDAALAMLRSGSGRPIWYVHGAENGRVHAMGAHVRELAAQARNVTVHTFYNVPDPGDQSGRDDDERGLITIDWLARNTPIVEAAYYLCGPRPFLRGMVGGLARTGVSLNLIRYEFFGPADELLAT